MGLPFLSRLLNICCYCLLFTVLILGGLLSVAGDLWWPTTFFLFAPRWLIAIPVFLLVPFAALISCRLLLPLLAALLLIFGPIMGFTFPVSNTLKPTNKPLRIVTCNLQNGKFDLNALNAFIAGTQPEIVAFQELPANTIIKSLDGWQHVFEGDLHIFSRYPLVVGDYRKANVPLHKWPRTCFLYCTVKSPSGDITFGTVHLPSPRYGLQSILDKSTIISLKRKKLLIEETEYRRQKSQEISTIVGSLPSPKIIAGDFNLPVDSKIYRNYWGQYSNTFSMRGFGYGWTERASVRGIPVAVRIDHILTGKGVTPMICEIGSDIGSDHLPLIADLAFQ